MTDKSNQRTDDRTTRLLQRDLPADYREQWTNILAQEKEEERLDTTSVVVFRLDREWMALSCHAFREFTAVSAIHRIPHRTDNVLLGLTNIRGELHLAVSLHALLEVESGEQSDDSESSRVFRRMAVLSKDGEAYVAPVDEVAGLHRITGDEILPPPVTLERAAANHTRGIFRHGDHSVALLEDELLFYNLRRHVE
jgi:chemotaxis-related protein WspD